MKLFLTLLLCTAVQGLRLRIPSGTSYYTIYVQPTTTVGDLYRQLADDPMIQAGYRIYDDDMPGTGPVPENTWLSFLKDNTLLVLRQPSGPKGPEGRSPLEGIVCHIIGDTNVGEQLCRLIQCGPWEVPLC